MGRGGEVFGPQAWPFRKKCVILCPTMTDNCISIKRARVNNLKDVSLDIPRDRFVVVTGLSGSGKSSLAFDTIYAEGQRRYMNTLSPYAKHFMGILE